MIVTVGLNGFKSFYGTGSVQFGKLTVLAGSNSSGKSALMQPLLLMKQTLESPFDPGPLLLEGPNVRMTSAGQILSKQRTRGDDQFTVVVGLDGSNFFGNQFKKGPGGFSLAQQTVAQSGDEKMRVILKEGEELSAKSDKITTLAKFSPIVKAWASIKRGSGPTGFVVNRDRCTFGMAVRFGHDQASGIDIDITQPLTSLLKDMIHVPGLRGDPERDYKTTAVGSNFPGTFDNYVASVILKWQSEASPKLSALNDQLSLIGLNSNASAVEVLDTRVSIEVSRIPRVDGAAPSDRVSIADVGLGVSQILPFLVAMLAAKKGQVVYVEQPELHLHPASQLKLAEVIRRAISRGVQVILETHSAILLRGLQIAVAKGEIDEGTVVLNWFSRDADTGSTKVSAKWLESDGSIGDWPTDFEDIGFNADSDYLDAVAERERKKTSRSKSRPAT